MPFGIATSLVRSDLHDGMGRRVKASTNHAFASLLMFRFEHVHLPYLVTISVLIDLPSTAEQSDAVRS